jgi:2-polyprenyl-3-methyl-5-hydroxy-6-metoxy-1,4-benzoquinol methylase
MLSFALNIWEIAVMSSWKLVPDPHYGFLKIEPTPTVDEINLFYSREFYSGEYNRFNDSTLEVYLEDSEFYEGIWSDLLFNIDKYYSGKVSGLDILDVGCGWSEALSFLSSKGMNCFGFDPAIEAINYGKSKGLNLLHAGLESMDVFQDKQFDVVMMNNVLEHMRDPVLSLTEIKEKVMKENSLLIIDVPNEFNAFQLAAKETFDLQEWWVAPPGHLNYFSHDTLIGLLRGLGFKIYDSFSSFPLEMFILFGDCYVSNPDLGKQCHKKRVAFETNLRRSGRSGVLRDFYSALAKLNLGRQITVYATK